MGMFFIAAMIAAAATSAAVDAARLDALPGGMPARAVRSLAMVVLSLIVSRATARVGMDAGVRDDGSPRPPRTSRVGPWIDVALHVWVLWGGHWAQAAWVLSGEHLVPAMLIAWLPWAFAGLLRADAERRVKAEFYGRPFGVSERRSALGLGARIRALFALPMLLSAGLEAALQAVPAAEAVLFGLGMGGQVMVSAVNMLVLVGLSPFLVGWLLDVRPIGSDALRGALQSDLAKQGLGACPIGEVKTGNAIPNAAYLGIGGWSRRIVVTDLLLELLGPEELRGVVAHETAHGKKRHIPFIVGFILAMIGIAAAFTDDLIRLGEGIGTVLALGNRELAPAMAGLVLAFAGASWFMLGVWWFGKMSRAFETEADLEAAHALGSGEHLAKSLLALHREFGGPIDRAHFRHPSILSRVKLLGAFDENPAVFRTATAPARRWRMLVLAGIVLALLGGARHLEDTLVVGPLRVAVRLGERTDDEVRLATGAERARALLGDAKHHDEAVRLGVAAIVGLVDLDLKAGRFDAARGRLADLAAAWPVGDPIGDYNRAHMEALLAVATRGGDDAYTKVRLAEDARRQLESVFEARGLTLDPVSARSVDRELTIARLLCEPNAAVPEDPPSDAPAWHRAAVERARALKKDLSK